jgi:hypothetical protein
MTGSLGLVGALAGDLDPDDRVARVRPTGNIMPISLRSNRPASRRGQGRW